MSERVLTQRELNRALLARQLLLERVRLPIPRALERIAGIQAQYAPSMYVGLWSRLEDFDRDALTRALERRSVVQATLLRVTIHLVSKRDFWPFALGLRRARQQWWLKTWKKDEAAAVAAAEKLRALMADGPKPRKAVDEVIGRTSWHGADLWYDLVRIPPSGTWERRRADLYAAAEDWVGPPEISEDDALAHLVRSYLAGFGPATRKDVSSYTGVPLTPLAPAFERLPLRTFRDERGRELVDVPRAPLPDPETRAPVRFLPWWDSTLLVHARRTGILPHAYRDIVFDVKVPPSMPTFLVDGVVRGAWRYEKGRVMLEPFERISREARRELKEEGERLAAFFA